MINLTHPEHHERVNAYWQQVFRRISPESAQEFRIQRVDGAERIIHAQGSLVGKSGEHRPVGVVQDITERRHAQQALEASEHRNRALVEQVPVAVYIAGIGAEGEWEFVSPHIERMLGYPVQEWTSNSAQWYSVIHPTIAIAWSPRRSGSEPPATSCARPIAWWPWTGASCTCTTRPP